MNIFDGALKSLQEAIDYERGDISKGRSVVRELKPVAPLKEYSGEDIKRIRELNNYVSFSAKLRYPCERQFNR